MIKSLSLEMAEPARMSAEFNRTLKIEKQEQTQQIFG
jgi:hypothetical protein